MLNISRDILVVIFLRGAADALNLVIPFGDADYYTLRPSLGIARPDDQSAGKAERAINLDGFFGLHPALNPLLPAWQAGHLGIIHACGAPDESRSHFKAQELMERGVADERGPASGWIGRYLTSLDTGNLSPLRATGLGALPQRSLSGGAPITALRSISEFHIPVNNTAAQQVHTALSALYQGNAPLAVLGQKTLQLLDTFQALDPSSYRPAGETPYPETEFGRGLQQIAMLIKAQVGLEVAAIDHGNWDTHFAQGGSSGLMANLTSELGQGMAAFHADLYDYLAQLTIVVMTEFGRRVRENGSLGTDHGHGALMMLLGGNVAGSKVHSHWPGLGATQLTGPGDLAATTDYRDVLAEVCQKRLRNPSTEIIFPNYTPRIYNLLHES